ncbi:GPN-loop GTPase 2 [Morella rubra]|uniref:GPN-loop GTPase 2 n=1 Tax=Morella rubra TaxID=262757 RepID=A0A6A1UY37_9ROSI|nr:GPN-loop GTPase 2 [Morella rubra]
MVFGQVVIGPPGSGKTTYCNGMSQFLKLIGRKVAVINLDPANDALPYECVVNIEDLIKLDDVMMEHSLGPNGGEPLSLLICFWIVFFNLLMIEVSMFANNGSSFADHYLLFDFPGQVELFFLHSNAKNVIVKLIKKLNLRLTAVHLVDAHLCSDPGKYVSALLLSLSTMLHMELPHVNVLSKIDLIESYGRLDDGFQDKESVGNLVKLIDKTNGYIFAGIDASAAEFSKIAVGPLDWDYFRYPCFLLILDIIFTIIHIFVPRLMQAT